MAPLLRTLLCLALVTTPAVAQRSATAVSGARLEYRARAAKLTPDDVVNHFALAQWCEKKKLPRCQRWELHEVLRISPDHIGARAMLGQVKHAGEWMSRDDARRRQSMVLFEGRWLRKYDAARIRQQRTSKAHGLAVQHRANLLLVKLSTRDDAVRESTRKKLLALATLEAMPDLARLANRVARQYAGFWKTQPAQPVIYTGLMTIRATNTEVLGIDTFTTSLGNGTPVRLQLPRTRTISINTTLPVPLGIRGSK